MEYIELFITAIIALALFAPLQQYVNEVNASGVSAVLIGLVPVLYIILLIAGFAYALKRHKK